MIFNLNQILTRDSRFNMRVNGILAKPGCVAAVDNNDNQNKANSFWHQNLSDLIIIIIISTVVVGLHLQLQLQLHHHDYREFARESN